MPLLGSMAGDAEDRFEVAMIAVKRHFDHDEFEDALPLCAKALQLQPDSVIVHKCRIFALLSLSRWAEALQSCDKYATDVEKFVFERAYCLYRLNRFQEALNLLEADDAPSGRSKCLEAQVRYRMGNYASCAAMYESMYNDDPDRDVGFLVNAVASRVSDDNSKDALSLMADHENLLESSYELCFNLACALIEEGKLAEAEERLNQAKEICTAELIQAEELTEEDEHLIEEHEELAALLVQSGCVLQRRGQADEAHTLYSKVLKQRPSKLGQVDITVLAVACNNSVVAKSAGKSLVDSLKRINVVSKDSLEHKLTRKQTLEIAINKCLLLLRAKKIDEAKREMQKLDSAFPNNPRVAIVQAAISTNDKKQKNSEEVLQAYLANHPGNAEVLLCLAHLYWQQHRYDQAVEALAQLSDRERSQPQTVEASIAMHLKQKMPEKAAACLQEALNFWLKDASDEESLAAVLRLGARLAKQLRDNKLAAEVYQMYLENVDGSDVEALCGLVHSLAGSDVARAEQYVQRLKVPSYDHLDPEELEMGAVPKLGLKKQSDKDAEQPEEGEGEVKKTKKRRKKKIRYPKGFDPAHPGPPPDPERWLPKKERSSYKMAMKKRDKKIDRKQQGGVSVDDNAFRKQGPSTAQVEVSKDTSRPSRNQGRKKGKK